MSKVINLFNRDKKQKELDSEILETLSCSEKESQILLTVKLLVILLSLSLVILILLVGNFNEETNRIMSILISIGSVFFLILWPLYFFEKKTGLFSKWLKKIN